jgi:hypothetical protein
MGLQCLLLTAETTIRPLRLRLSDKQITWQVALRLVRARIRALANAGQDARAIQTSCATPKLSPTSSKTSGTDRQSESVAAINGPIAPFVVA